MKNLRAVPPRRPACPICGKPSEPATKPFCSARCADVDLGRWLNERYVIPGPDEPDERQDEERGGDKPPPRS